MRARTPVWLIRGCELQGGAEENGRATKRRKKKRFFFFFVTLRKSGFENETSTRKKTALDTHTQPILPLPVLCGKRNRGRSAPRAAQANFETSCSRASGEAPSSFPSACRLPSLYTIKVGMHLRKGGAKAKA